MRRLFVAVGSVLFFLTWWFFPRLEPVVLRDLLAAASVVFASIVLVGSRLWLAGALKDRGRLAPLSGAAMVGALILGVTAIYVLMDILAGRI